MTARMKARLLAGVAAGALLLAAGLGVLSDRMIAGQNAFDRADREHALGRLPADQWGVVDGFFAKPADAMLSLSDDRAYRKALVLFWKSQPAGSTQWMKNSRSAKRTLLVLAENKAAEPSRRATAWNAIGILEFQEAVFAAKRSEMDAAKKHLAMSTRAFMKAVATNGADEAARHNLELVQMLNASQSKPDKEPSPNPGTKPPGNGY